MQVWNTYDNSYFLDSNNTKVPKLEPAIYKLQTSPRGELYIDYQSDQFQLPARLYGLTTEFIERVVKSWNSTQTNIGVLLSGIKGTSKSVTAKIIANSVKLPVIVVDAAYDGLADFVNTIEQEFVVFIDEFEKIYERGKISSLLSLLDGVSTNPYRRLYLFTSNSPNVNENLLNRPSRIRYHKSFDKLPKEAIFEIVDDLLRYPSLKDDLIETIGKLEYQTIDAVMSLITEVNLHKQKASVLLLDFNLDYLVARYTVFRQKYENGILGSSENLGTATRISHGTFDEDSIMDHFHINGRYYGCIAEIESETQAIVEHDDAKYLYEISPYYVSNLAIR